MIGAKKRLELGTGCMSITIGQQRRFIDDDSSCALNEERPNWGRISVGELYVRDGARVSMGKLRNDTCRQ